LGFVAVAVAVDERPTGAAVLGFGLDVLDTEADALLCPTLKTAMMVASFCA
jgi:hypothetical protein